MSAPQIKVQDGLYCIKHSSGIVFLYSKWRKRHSCHGILKTLAFVLSLEEHEEFKLVGIGGEAIRGEEVFCFSKTVNHKG